MKREPQAPANSRHIRAAYKPLIFKNSEYNYGHGYSLRVDQFCRFARDNHFPQSNEAHAIAEHRPAIAPGAD